MSRSVGLRRSLFGRYVGYFAAVVAIALTTSGLAELYFEWRDRARLAAETQRQRAHASAALLEAHFSNIENSLRGLTSLPESLGAVPDALKLLCVRLLRQAPAITNIRIIDGDGREALFVSRLFPNVIGSHADFAADEAFNSALRNARYYGPVTFRKDSEPYMTMAFRQESPEVRVVHIDVSLLFLWEIINRQSLETGGTRFVIDGRGQLVAHPDMKWVLNKTDASVLPQVAELLHKGTKGAPVDLYGRRVVTAHAPIPPLGWNVFSEQLQAEAYEPLHALSRRSALFLIFGFLLAAIASLFLARRIHAPVAALQRAAEEFGRGNLTFRLPTAATVPNEFRDLASVFNRMAGQILAAREVLESQVRERTEQLAQANASQRRFLAVATHELNQPLFAVELLVRKLAERSSSPPNPALVASIQRSVNALRGLLDDLLDISKLDTRGAVPVHLEAVEILPLLERLEEEFAAAAREKGLRLRTRPCAGAVLSDAVLLERILRNLVTNAIRHTARGGVLIAFRRRSEQVWVDVVDTGSGIETKELGRIFDEFYQVTGTNAGRRGLGLGLSIVRRLAVLLGHEITVRSRPGRGSMFRVAMMRAD